MKKVLSMVLALALVLTTLVVPMTVSASGEEFTISYKLMNGEAEAEAIYPGDEIIVEVYANANEAVSAAYELYIPYPANMTLDETGIIKSGNFVKFVNEAATEIKTAADGGTKVGEYSFTVPTTGEGSHSIAAISADDTDSYFTVGFNEFVPSADAKGFTVLACDAVATATVGEAEAVELTKEGTNSLKSTAAQNVVVAASSTVSAVSKITVKTADADGNFTSEGTEIESGAVAFNAFGKYQITFTTIDDNKTHTYVIVYSSDVVANLVATYQNTGAKPGDTIAVDVKVENLQGNVVEALTFDVEYDETVFDAGANIVDKKVTFEAEEGQGVAEGNTVLTLNFTVKSDAKVVGVETISIKNQKLAVDNAFDPEAANIDNTSADSVNVTVYSEEAVTVAALGEIDYAKSREIAVSQTAEWDVAEGELSVAYNNYAEQQAEPVAAATIYDNGTKIAALPGVVSVTKSEYYYVAARFGTEGNYVYVILADYEPAELKIDLAAPSVTMTTVFEGWVNSTDITEIEFAVADGEGAGASKLYYKLNGAGEFEEVAVVGDVAKVALEEGTVYTSIVVYAEDALENASAEKTENITYDDVAPVIAVEEGAYTDAGIPITVTLTPVTGQSAEPTNVAVSHKANAEAVAESKGTVDFAENEAVYTATSNGYYIFTVTDEAGNETVVESEEISVGKLSVLNAPEFAVLSSAEEAAGSLKTDAELDALYGTEVAATNGSFTYLKVFVEADAEGSTTEYTLTKGGELVEEWTPATALAAAADEGDYVLTVKTTMDDNEADYQTASYTFSIADRESFKTVNGDNKYRLTDYLIMQLMVGADKNFATDAAANYTGGYFAGDVNADLNNDWANDSALMLDKIKSANTWKTYDFAIYNGLSY